MPNMAAQATDEQGAVGTGIDQVSRAVYRNSVEPGPNEHQQHQQQDARRLAFGVTTEEMLKAADNRDLGVVMQTVRAVLAVAFTLVSCISILMAQAVAIPLKPFAPDFWRAWISITKQSFGIFLVALSQFFTPIRATISYGSDMDPDAFTINPDGTLRTSISSRLIMIANHQLYTDWLYLWWVALSGQHHGSLVIMLKESLRKLPLLGWGMDNYRFIFMSRRWAKDKITLDRHFAEMNSDGANPQRRWPLWLLLFPEGTTFCQNGVNKSNAFAEQHQLKTPKNLLLPRSTGLRYAVQKLSGTVDYVYDVTIHYSGLAPGEYGENHYTLKSMYMRGNCPRFINMHWRRYKVADIPYDDEAKFDQWIRQVYYEKDTMLETFKTTGSFVKDTDTLAQQVVVPVRLNSALSLFQIFVVPLNIILIANLLYKHLPRLF